jgi:hypothetical protein
MGFFSGRVSCARFRVTGRSPKSFGPEHLQKLTDHAMGRQRIVSADGVEVGWTAGDHILDTRFDLAKNIVNDTLHFALRVDVQKIPADLLRAYTHVELEGLAASNPSGLPSGRQKREARANALQRLEQEARDGRFLRRKAYPLLWDALSRELLLGTTALTVIERLHTLFQQTFGLSLEALGAGRQAFLQAEVRNQTRSLEDAQPAAFQPGQKLTEVSWLPDETNRDFLGNEFLLWLWYVLDAESDTLLLGDKSEVTAMLARTLVLECPRGQTGKESITSDAPGRLPEVRRAIQAGKLPRKAGLTLVRHDHQYEFTLHAESLAITGAKLPAPPSPLPLSPTGGEGITLVPSPPLGVRGRGEGAEDDRTRLEERVTQVRHLLETLDLLYDAFGNHRLGSGWPKELSKIQKWVRQEK